MMWRGMFLWIAVPLLAQTESHPHGKIKQACNQCHVTSGWSDPSGFAAFDHTTTGFPLAEAHADRECRDCHQSLVFHEAGKQCRDCHTDVHQGRLGSDCADCHATVTWDNRIQMMARHELTNFPLLGPHAQAQCEDCHVNQQRHEFSLVSSECESCHQVDFQTSRNPNHVQAGFPRDCLLCHSPLTHAWSADAFDHSFYPLTGGHTAVDCEACHTQGYTNTPTDCIACHRQDYTATLDPNHVANGFSENCEDCHSTAGWTPAAFDHNQTQFPLSGGHAISDCLACHAQGYNNTPTDCISCHREDYTATLDPNHVANGFSENCETCHSTVVWLWSNSAGSQATVL